MQPPTFSSQLEVAAKAAQSIEHLCGFDCDPTPWWERAWENAPIFLALGAFCLPVALLVVWMLHLAKLDRSIIANATFAAVLAMFVVLMTEFLGLISVYPAVEALTQMAVPMGTLFFVPMLSIGFFGAALFDLFLKRHRGRKEAEISLGISND